MLTPDTPCVIIYAINLEMDRLIKFCVEAGIDFYFISSNNLLLIESEYLNTVKLMYEGKFITSVEQPLKVFIDWEGPVKDISFKKLDIY